MQPLPETSCEGVGKGKGQQRPVQGVEGKARSSRLDSQAYVYVRGRRGCVSVGLGTVSAFQRALFPPSNFQKPRGHTAQK